MWHKHNKKKYKWESKTGIFHVIAVNSMETVYPYVTMKAINSSIGVCAREGWMVRDKANLQQS